MKILLYIVCILITTIIVLKILELKNIAYKKPEFLSDKKILTVYYSNGGNTKNIAHNINTIVGGNIKEIQLIENYPNNIFKMSKFVRKQIKNGDLPQIKDIDIRDYDIIFIGSPIWNLSMSLPTKAFLKNNNFENMILIPFFTYSGGAKKNKIVSEIENLATAKEVKNPLFMFENGIILQKEQIIKWLNNM